MESAERQTRRYRVTGLRCGACADSLTRGLRGVGGVVSAEADAAGGWARVELDRDVADGQLAVAAELAGGYQLGERIDDEPVVETDATADEPGESLYPLALIVGFILGVTLLVAARGGDWSAATLGRHFMAGFFLVFGFFKLLDIAGFVRAYREYDLVARAVPGWARAYPFVEVGLGVCYLLGVATIAVNGVTLVLMLVGAVGVLRALRAGRRIRCACLGTALNLPMTTVTLIEDLVMAAMAAAMLVVALA